MCVLQAIRGAVLPDFDPAKYEHIFNRTSVEILNTAEDPVLLNVISKMCEKMFDVHINCTFERHNKMLDQSEKVLVEFLLQTTVGIKHHLKYRADQESLDLPSGYIESAFPAPEVTEF